MLGWFISNYLFLLGLMLTGLCVVFVILMFTKGPKYMYHLFFD